MELVSARKPEDTTIEKYFSDFHPQNESQDFALRRIAVVLMQIIENKQKILSADKWSKNSFRFKNPVWINLWGTPGTGKSHLINNFNSALASEGFKTEKHTWRFSNNTWAIDSLGSIINTVDDWFAEHTDSSKVGHNDIRQLSKCIQFIYEKKALLISASNFSIIGDPNFIRMISESDATGRLRSRLNEFASGEHQMIGVDCRQLKREQGFPDLF